MRGLAFIVMLCHILPAAAATGDGLAWVQHPGERLPVGSALRDEAGRAVTLSALVGGVPAILDLGYFHCPALCGVTRADVYAALQMSGLQPGREVSLISISIDPAESPADAARAKAADLARLPMPWAAGAHYVTGSAETVAALSRAVGFQTQWNAQFKQFIHPSGIVVLTSTGRVSSYLLGVGYTGGDLRAAVARAAKGGVAQASLPILLLCFHFDPTTGRYTLEILKVLRLLAALTVVTMLVSLVVLQRRRRSSL